MRKNGLSFIILFCFFSICYSQTELRRDIPYYHEPSTLDLVSTVTQLKEVKAVPSSLKHMQGEMETLMHCLKSYNLNAPPHQTDGWSNFTKAEWPFMAMAYTGFALCHLVELHPSLREVCKENVTWILKTIPKPAISGFMKAHFGEPFPENKPPQKVSVFLHGHYLYLALLARQTFGLKEFDRIIHILYLSMYRDYLSQPLLASYKSMHYLSDNGSALAAMGLYDKIFKTTRSKFIREKAIQEMKTHYMDSKSNLVCTYINPYSKKATSGPRGIGVMYLGMYLNDIDEAFSKHQYQQALKTMVTPLKTAFSTIPATSTFLNIVLEMPELLICMEHPNTTTWAERLIGDTDSGPVVLGVGTSASAFFIVTAALMEDYKKAYSTLQLAQHMAKYQWIDQHYVATQAFHEVGQAILFYGKVLTFKGIQPL